MQTRVITELNFEVNFIVYGYTHISIGIVANSPKLRLPKRPDSLIVCVIFTFYKYTTSFRNFEHSIHVDAERIDEFFKNST